MKLHDVVEGDGDGAPWLVLSHSLGTTLRLFDGQVPVLAPRFRVLRYDHRGHGRSEVPPGPYAIEDLARDAVELLDAHGVARARFVGISIGGAVAMMLAAEHPERVERLALCFTSSRFGDPELWLDRAALVRSEGIEPLVDSALGRWLTPTAPRETVETTAAMLRATPPAGYAACCEALAAFDFRTRLGEIRCPTLVVSATEDPSTGPDHGRALAAGIPTSTLVILEGAAHLGNLERPAEFNSALLDHLAA